MGYNRSGNTAIREPSRYFLRNLPPSTADIYPTTNHMVSGYSGHVPGEAFQFGRGWEVTTYNPLRVGTSWEIGEKTSKGQYSDDVNKAKDIYNAALTHMNPSRDPPQWEDIRDGYSRYKAIKDSYAPEKSIYGPRSTSAGGNLGIGRMGGPPPQPPPGYTRYTAAGTGTMGSRPAWNNNTNTHEMQRQQSDLNPHQVGGATSCRHTGCTCTCCNHSGNRLGEPSQAYTTYYTSGTGGGGGGGQRKRWADKCCPKHGVMATSMTDHNNNAVSSSYRGAMYHPPHPPAQQATLPHPPPPKSAQHRISTPPAPPPAGGGQPHTVTFSKQPRIKSAPPPVATRLDPTRSSGDMFHLANQAPRPPSTGGQFVRRTWPLSVYRPDESMKSGYSGFVPRT